MCIRDRHKPFLDPITLKCPVCGGSMHRVPEVIDCWYDSGSMPFAQWHYPFENKEEFESHFPANFISEAVDQTRGWFYTLLAIGTLIFDKAPFENCIVLGHVQDKDGQKTVSYTHLVTPPFALTSAIRLLSMISQTLTSGMISLHSAESSVEETALV